MFREIRRKNNVISISDAKQLLKNERRGVLALNGDDDYPYAIPINFLFCENENKIFFHGSRVGYKVDCLNRNDKVCFTVYGNITIKEETWAPFVQSVVVFGKCKLIKNNDLAIKILEEFARKYYQDEELIYKEIYTSNKAVQIFELEIEHISGKQVQEK